MSGKKDNFWERAADCKPLMVSGAVGSILGFPLAVLPIAGAQLPMFLEAAGSTAVVWLPPLTLLTGFLIGWNSRRWQMARENVTAERIAELEGKIAELGSERDEREADARHARNDLDNAMIVTSAARDERDKVKKEARALRDERDALVARLAEIEAGPTLDEALGSVSGMALGALGDMYLKGRAIGPDECEIPGAAGLMTSLQLAGLAEKIPDAELWDIRPSVRREIMNRLDVQENLIEAKESALFVSDMESDADREAEAKALAEALRAQPYWQKVMLACLRDKDSVILSYDKDMGPDALAAFESRCSEEMRRMVALVSVGVSGTRVELTYDGWLAVTLFPDFLKGVDWRLFTPIDEEFTYDDLSSPFAVTCGDMSWLVNVDL